MPTIEDVPAKHRWPRAQRFSLSTLGVEAEERYRGTIGDARAEGGRASFELARGQWAKAHGIQPEDGVYLGEVRSGPMNLAALVTAVDACGHTRSDVLAALGRLVDAGLLLTASAA